MNTARLLSYCLPILLSSCYLHSASTHYYAAGHTAACDPADAPKADTVYTDAAAAYICMPRYACNKDTQKVFCLFEEEEEPAKRYSNRQEAEKQWYRFSREYGLWLSGKQNTPPAIVEPQPIEGLPEIAAGNPAPIVRSPQSQRLPFRYTSSSPALHITLGVLQTVLVDVPLSMLGSMVGILTGIWEEDDDRTLEEAYRLRDEGLELHPATTPTGATEGGWSSNPKL